MEDRFLRNLDALTETECAVLRTKKVLIAGCGGIGGYLEEYLLRVGIGEIRVVDPDCFEPSNFNRQLLCTEDSLGRYKAETAARRAASVAPSTSFSGHICRLDETTLPGLLRGCDAALDALDNIPGRLQLKAECDRQGIPYVFGAVNGWCAQAVLSLPGDGILDKLFPEHCDTEACKNSALSFSPALCAALQASLCVQLLCERPVKPGVFYSFNLEDMELNSIRL